MTEKIAQPDKKAISPFWTTSAISALFIILINEYIDTDKIKLMTSLAPFVSSIIAYILQYVFAMFMFSPQEFAINKKLKRDEKALLKHLKSSEKNPSLYTEDEINELRKDLQETRKQRTRIGRNSL